MLAPAGEGLALPASLASASFSACSLVICSAKEASPVTSLAGFLPGSV